MSSYCVTPSRNMTLTQLKKIQIDNYVGTNGVDYNADEIDARIIEIEMKQAMEFDRGYPKALKIKAKYLAVNDKLVEKIEQPKAFEIKFNLPKAKPLFPVNMAYERAV